MSEDRTNECYRYSMLIMLGQKEGKILRRLGPVKLVHGYPRLQAESDGYPEGTLYGHAWLEVESETHGTLCHDVVKSVTLPKELYYELGRIDPSQCCRYSLSKAKQMLSDHGHFGPWELIPADAVFNQNKEDDTDDESE